MNIDLNHAPVRASEYEELEQNIQFWQQKEKSSTTAHDSLHASAQYNKYVANFWKQKYRDEKKESQTLQAEIHQITEDSAATHSTLEDKLSKTKRALEAKEESSKKQRVDSDSKIKDLQSILSGEIKKNTKLTVDLNKEKEKFVRMENLHEMECKSIKVYRKASKQEAKELNTKLRIANEQTEQTRKIGRRKNRNVVTQLEELLTQVKSDSYFSDKNDSQTSSLDLPKPHF